jgi:hypothetical protein
MLKRFELLLLLSRQLPLLWLLLLVLLLTMPGAFQARTACSCHDGQRVTLHCEENAGVGGCTA